MNNTKLPDDLEHLKCNKCGNTTFLIIRQIRKRRGKPHETNRYLVCSNCEEYLRLNETLGEFEFKCKFCGHEGIVQYIRTIDEHTPERIKESAVDLDTELPILRQNVCMKCYYNKVDHEKLLRMIHDDPDYKACTNNPQRWWVIQNIISKYEKEIGIRVNTNLIEGFDQLFVRKSSQREKKYTS